MSAGFDPGFLAIFVGSQLTTVFMATPFSGAVSRMRANYAPLPVAVEGKKRKKLVKIENNCSGIIETLQRTWELEGVWGLFKGAAAASAATITVSLTSALATVFILSEGGDPGAGVIGNMVAKLGLSPAADLTMSLIATVAASLTLVPFSVLTSRAVVSPFRLPFSSASVSALLSRKERAQPWRLYTTPGLLFNYTIQTLAPICVSAFTLPILYGVAATASQQAQGFENAASPEYFGAVFVAIHTSLSFLTVPLTVAAEKIAVAPDYAEGEAAEAHAEAEAKFGRISADEDVVNLRVGKPRYTSLLDAITTIRAEEGLGALYRGWIWTALSLALPAMGSVMSAMATTAAPAAAAAAAAGAA